MNNSKPWYSSKTIWLAILQALAGITAAFYLQYPSVGFIVLTKSLLDIALRAVTEQPIQ